MEQHLIVFGPVPSRRLGRSLGINNIPPKMCTYSCVYCQLGRTNNMQIARRTFYEPEEILQNVQNKVEKAKEAGEPIDYLAFVPDGEPTLDLGLAHEIDLLKSLGIKIAIITNSSLMWDEDAREALLKADWVSLKVDAVRERIWRRIDRPHGALELAAIQNGMFEFAQTYTGCLATETMLIKDLNDDEDHLAELADFLARLQPDVAYLSIPTRPPAETWVRPSKEQTINRAFQLISEKMDADKKSLSVEYLIGYEGNAFASTGNVEQDLLSITSVHPMREDAVDQFLRRAGMDWALVSGLLEQNRLVETKYQGQKFYMRKIN